MHLRIDAFAAARSGVTAAAFRSAARTARGRVADRYQRQTEDVTILPIACSPALTGAGLVSRKFASISGNSR